MGVKFFVRQDTQVIASGDWDKTIPLKALKSVVELELIKRKLKWIVPCRTINLHSQTPATRTAQKAEDSALQPHLIHLDDRTACFILKFVVRSAYCTYLNVGFCQLGYILSASRSWNVLPMWPRLSCNPTTQCSKDSHSYRNFCIIVNHCLSSEDCFIQVDFVVEIKKTHQHVRK